MGGNKITSRVLTFGKDMIAYLPVHGFGYDGEQMRTNNEVGASEISKSTYKS
jgi:hypothetical protein